MEIPGSISERSCLKKHKQNLPQLYQVNNTDGNDISIEGTIILAGKACEMP